MAVGIKNNISEQIQKTLKMYLEYENRLLNVRFLKTKYLATDLEIKTDIFKGI
jgi:hypothetical protein